MIKLQIRRPVKLQQGFDIFGSCIKLQGLSEVSLKCSQYLAKDVLFVLFVLFFKETIHTATWLQCIFGSRKKLQGLSGVSLKCSQYLAKDVHGSSSLDN